MNSEMWFIWKHETVKKRNFLVNRIKHIKNTTKTSKHLEEKFLFQIGKKSLTVKESRKNDTELTGSPLYLWKNEIRVYLSHMNENQVNSFCKLFKFNTGVIFKNKQYGTFIKNNEQKIVSFINCTSSDKLSLCSHKLKTEQYNRYLQITCTMKS